MLFVDGIVLVDGTNNGVNVKLEFWRETLKVRGFRLNKDKKYRF